MWPINISNDSAADYSRYKISQVLIRWFKSDKDDIALFVKVISF